MRFAVGAIFKNEAPYLIDWLAWHRALGVTDFFIADNDSTDGTSELLTSLHRRGVLRRIAFPTVGHRNPQNEAYAHILSCARLAGIDWVAFIDADEFLMPEAAGVDLRDFLHSVPADVGAIAVNWALFGSGGAVSGQSDPVFLRFPRRGEQHIAESRIHGGNRHYKSILRTAAYGGKVVNPHHFALKPGYRYAHVDGRNLDPSEPGIAADTIWAPLRLNHYAVKSWSEFCQKKAPRGLADFPNITRSSAYFTGYDLNDTTDGIDPGLLPGFRKRQAQLLRILGRRAGLHADAVASMVGFEPPPPPDGADPAAGLNEAVPRQIVRPGKWVRRSRRLRLGLSCLVQAIRPDFAPRDWRE